MEAVSAVAYDYFSRLTGITMHGTRVDPEIKRRVQGAGR